MGQIIGGKAKPKRCNLNALGSVPTPAAGEYILVSSDNSMTSDGQGNFDCYIKGDGTKAATALPLQYLDAPLIEDEEVLVRALMKHEDRIADIEEQMAGSDSYMGEDEELTIARALVDLNENGGGGSGSGGSVSGIVTIGNSDTIAIVGASFTDGSTPAKGKDWTSILSALTDYNYIDNSKSGSNPFTRLNDVVRSGVIKGKYAMICMYSGNGLTEQDAGKVVPILCDSLESCGIEPIICSTYDINPATEGWIKNYAKEKNYYYYPCSEYYGLTYNGRSNVGDNGYHLGTYSIGVWSNGYMIQAPYIDRPKQSLKLFRIRTDSSSKSLDELVFHTNEERFENFYELYFGQLQGGNEYESLAQGVTFSNKALISAVLPINCSKLSKVSLKLNAPSDVAVYVLNTLATPYPVTTNYARFSIENESTLPSDGAVYSNGSGNFTVVTTILGENGMYATIYCTPNISATGGAGTLTKVSGTGPSSLSYSMVESASLSLESAVASDNGGHWELLTGSNGLYNLNGISGRVHLDKVHFLVVKSGDFTISGVIVSYEGIEYKTVKAGHIVEFDSNEYHDSQELINEPTFGTIGTTLNNWIDGNGVPVVSQAGYDNKYIYDSSVVMLSNTNSMEQTIVTPTVGKYYLEVMSRYYHDNVSEDSYDFNDLFIDVTSVGSARTYTWTLSDKVGLYPRISRFEIPADGMEDIKIKLYSTSKGIEVFKVSFKKY